MLKVDSHAGDVFDVLLAELPALVARAEVPRLTGGTIASRTLANLDSMGRGPAGRFQCGGKTIYPRETLVSWLRARARPAGATK